MGANRADAEARPPGGQRLAWAAALAALLLGCVSPPTVAEEAALARQLDAQVRAEMPILRDDTVDRYVDAIGDRLARAMGPQEFQPEFTVVADNDINAFATFGGSVYVNSGLILRSRNVSELAGVIGHELGHVKHRHVAEKYARGQNASLLRNLMVTGAGIAAGGGAATVADMVTGVSTLAYMNNFSREDEIEADDFAVEILPRAGYDPMGLVTMFETLQNESGGRGASFLSSHPAPADRISGTLARIQEEGPFPGVRRDDGGKLEIIQQRIRLLTGQR
jgi:predicted Zn-dependent protease